MRALACSIMCMGMLIAASINPPQSEKDLSFVGLWIVWWTLSTVIFLVIGD